MRHLNQVIVRARQLHGILVVCGILALGCSARVSGNPGTGATMGGTGASTGRGGNTAGGGTAGTGAGGATTVLNCTPTDPTNVAAPERVVRLTLSQVVNTISALFPVAGTIGGSTTTIGAALLAEHSDIGNPALATFPPLNSTREGVSIIADRWATLDGIASTVGQYVADNFAAVTRCTTATDACAQTYLQTLAAAVFRRPLDMAPATGEATRFNALYTSLRAAAIGSTVQEATQYAVYALLSSPQFLYRSEIGNPAGVSSTVPGVPLTPYEVASQLSFFLTDGPPDATLLGAAQSGALSNQATVLTQFNRLIATPGVRANLSNAMFVYYKLNLLDNVVIDTTKFPTFTVGLENAMYTEAQSFLTSVLWNGKLSDVLTSNATTVNSDLATLIYNVPVPTGATQATFAPTTLPSDKRSGILTQAAFITSRARTDATSVVARGLAIQETMLCGATPAAPMNLATAINANLALTVTEKEKAMIRDTTSPCEDCHSFFDAFGLVLENYDAIGRYRTVDDMNRPIDASTTLPPTVGSVTVANAVDFAQTLGASPAFANCMAKSVLQYAMSDVTSAPVALGGCAVQGIAKSFNASADQSFTEMVREVAVSNAVARRTLTQ